MAGAGALDRAKGMWPARQLGVSAVATFHVALALGTVTEPSGLVDLQEGRRTFPGNGG